MSAVPQEKLEKGGVKADTGKAPWHLFPWDAGTEVVRVLDYGRRKYTREWEVSEEEAIRWLTNLLSSKDPSYVIQIERGIATDSAALATKGNYVVGIQNSQSASEKTGDSGASEIQRKLLPTTEDERKTHTAASAMRTQASASISEGSELLPRSYQPCENSRIVGVEYVYETSSPLALNMSITVTKAGVCEGSYVAVATTVSGCLEKILSYCNERFPIFRDRSPINFEKSDKVVKIKMGGERNWEKGMDFSRLFSAGQRHLIAWWEGETIDPESGLPHLAHAACCVLFLLALEKRGFKKNDDRPSNLPR